MNVVTCLCGHADTDHALGEGSCDCGCPAYRPTSMAYTPQMAAHDAQHDGVAEQLVAEHALTPEVGPDGMWLDLANPEGVFPLEDWAEGTW